MATSTLPGFLARHIDLVEEGLREALAPDDTPLAAAARYVMGWQDQHGQPADARGKRLRPALCLAATEAFGAPASAGIPGAVAVELVHNFSLVHDEIQDRDGERHHRPTTWALLGEAQAINVGDYLYTTAIRALAEADVPAERRLAALGILNAAIAAMIHGQWSDLTFESRDDITVDEYLAMIGGKTGALFGAPLAMGALLAGASPATAEIVRQWGEQVGLAFQVHDDYLGVWGAPAETGKSNTNDIARRKKSLPVVQGLAYPDTAAVIRRVFALPEGPGTEDVRAVIAALEAAGIQDECRLFAANLASDASLFLEQLPVDSGDRERLDEVARYMVRRSG